jgi:hypothetical protein
MVDPTNGISAGPESIRIPQLWDTHVSCQRIVDKWERQGVAHPSRPSNATGRAGFDEP